MNFSFLSQKIEISTSQYILSNPQICFQKFSFSSQNWLKFYISPSHLHTNFFFEDFSQFCSLLEPEGRPRHFSFSSRNWRKGFHISFSLLDLTFWHIVNGEYPITTTTKIQDKPHHFEVLELGGGETGRRGNKRRSRRRWSWRWRWRLVEARGGVDGGMDGIVDGG